MKYISKFDAEAILKPHLDPLARCIKSGFDIYLEKLGPESHLHPIRTRASFIHDQIVHLIEEEFDNTPGTNIIVQNGLFLLGIEEILIRFKKLNDNLIPSNIPTQQQLDFDRQLDIPGFPSRGVYLNAGYTPNAFWSRLKSMNISFIVERRVKWDIDLGESVQQAKLFEFPDTSKVRSPGKRVIAKIPDNRKKTLRKNE